MEQGPVTRWSKGEQWHSSWYTRTGRPQLREELAVLTKARGSQAREFELKHIEGKAVLAVPVRSSSPVEARKPEPPAYRLGVPDKSIQAILRHANVNTTLTMYVKSVPADSRAAMQRLESALGNEWATATFVRTAK